MTGTASPRVCTALLALLLALAGCSAPEAGEAPVGRITGSGASFPFPLYSNWFKTFSRARAGVRIDYQSKGSGAGVRDFINRTVDFAASDAAMTDAQIAQVEGGALLLPVTAGEIVLAYNLPGVDASLRLPRSVYPGIFLGEVRRWNDPALAAANPGLRLPDLPITVVRRADSSGTTNALTRHLAAANPRWAELVGVGTTVRWPEAASYVAAPKNDGVAATIQQTPGSIGYIELVYARFSGMPTATLENAAGRFVAPGTGGGEAALGSAELPEDMRAWIDDPAAEDAYPIVTYTWLLFYRDQGDPAVAGVLRDLVRYCVTEGQALARRLGYVTLPETVAARVLAAAGEIR